MTNALNLSSFLILSKSLSCLAEVRLAVAFLDRYLWVYLLLLKWALLSSVYPSSFSGYVSVVVVGGDCDSVACMSKNSFFPEDCVD